MPTAAAKSPKTKCSGSKGKHHCSSGHSSNTSTPKCPDSTSANKPSSSKEPVLKEKDKSLRGHGSHEHSHSPSQSAKSDGHKQKEAHTEDTCELNSTLPISSSGFDGFRSPMGSHTCTILLNSIEYFILFSLNMRALMRTNCLFRNLDRHAALKTRHYQLDK